MDPIEIGMGIHITLMRSIHEAGVEDEADLMRIGRMIDILVGSAQVSAVENGLERSPEEYRALILGKLKSLKMAD